MKEQSTARFLKSATIMTAAGIICKLIGAIYRIPLTNIIGTEAMGIYSKAYLLYALLWMISTSGLPSAISKTVAECRASEDYGAAERVFLLSRRLLVWIGLALTIIMILFSPVIASSLGISQAGFAVACIAPSLMLVAVSAYMGYFQGAHHMAPSAATQIIGSAGKLIAGTALAAAFMKKGVVYAASGALLGVTISELLSIGFIHFRYKAYRKKNPCPPPKETKSAKEIIYPLLKIAIPITVCGAAIPLLNTLDAYLITYCLNAKGISHQDINSMYGVLNGMVSTLVNVPGAIALSISATILPFISLYKAQNDVKGMSSCSLLTTKLAFIVGLPCAIGLFMFARPIISFLYPLSSAITSSHQELGVTLLRCICPAIIGLCLMHSFNGALQGASQYKLSIISIAVAAIIKLGLGSIIMLFTPLGIIGAPIASSVAFLTAGIMNTVFATKHCYLKFDARSLTGIALASAAVAVICAIFNLALGGYVSTAMMFIAIFICVVIYVGMLIVFKVFTKNELELLPLREKNDKKYN